MSSTANLSPIESSDIIKINQPGILSAVNGTDSTAPEHKKFGDIIARLYQKIDSNQDGTVDETELLKFLESHRKDEKDHHGHLPPVGIMPPPPTPEVLLTDINMNNSTSGATQAT
ncbi:MAG: EF-hand domain-containing protein [Candidatus Margulisbacteria bacterium]|nr:EF-hand domain-containing protein [Candidatus Margulisiibacteriota bacterium]